MDTLVEGYSNPTNGFDYLHHHSIPAILEQKYNLNHDNSIDPSLLSSSPNPSDEASPLSSSPNPSDEASPSSGTSMHSNNSLEERDFFGACLKFVSQMLDEEEDLEYKPCMFQECLALQAAEKSLSDLLDNKDPHPTPIPLLVDQNRDSPDDDFTRSFSSQGGDNFIESNWIRDQQGEFDSSFGQSQYNYEPILQYNLQSFGYSNAFHGGVDGSIAALVSPFQVSNSYTNSQPNFENHLNFDLESMERTPRAVIGTEENGRRNNISPNGSRGKKNHNREDSDYAEVGGRSNKQLASNYSQESEDSLIFDKVLLCADLNPHLHGESEPERLKQNKQLNSSPVGRPRGKKQGKKKEVVDLRTLLTQCAQAVSSSDTRTVNDLLNRIRQHASPRGDGSERLAYYFANALEARLAGIGMPLYTAFHMSRISAAEILKAYQVYISACPFKIMSYFYANRSIGKLAKNSSTTLHIIDFGILYGFQWPCLIQRLSIRPDGPPKLRITGIDFPQPGFRPAERVEDTGRRLASYCKRFNVPFEFNAIAKKWHTIQLEDLKIKKDEVLAVNCLFRLKNIPDDTVSMKSPRDAVLNLIKRINPNMFIHGVVNGTYNAPFFVTRFREALFHFSSIFDMFDANVPREDEQRLMFEKEVFGKDIMSVVACEGTERVERPETYKQWQMRNVRAGFRQVALNREILEDVRKKVKLEYHNDFVVDEDGHWMLQGWKGRIILALSCWKPVQEL